MITGFCDESEEDHLETLSLMKKVEFNFSYMFFYSERPKTLAQRKYEDNIPTLIKKRRLQEVIDLQREHSIKHNQSFVGKIVEVLVEGPSKKSPLELSGRNNENCKVVFPKENAKKGDYVNVIIKDFTSATLKGKIV
jgi:tRNA-2-methylthio-N6-dimethylallyladenosine synthase